MSNIKTLTTKSGIISALAIDQRGALRRMLGENAETKALEDFKILVSETLTPYSSAILLDPELGLPASQKKDSNCGLLMAYEKTGYDVLTPGRLPDLIENQSVKRLKEEGADAIKLLVYVDVDEDVTVNDTKKAFVERVGSECLAEDLPLFLEIISYDANISDKLEYAKIKPRKVIEAMKMFADKRFNVAVLKVEVPVDMNFVESGSTFNGVLCGRATWAGGTTVYKEKGFEAAKEWFNSVGKTNIVELNTLVEELATPVN